MFDPTSPDWLNKYRTPSNYIPGQKEIEYFWPLTEQIPLGLDFSDCDTRRPLTMPTSIAQGSTLVSIGNTNPQWTTSQLIVTQDGIETPEITFTLNKKPYIIKRLMYKLLGIKWKVK